MPQYTTHSIDVEDALELRAALIDPGVASAAVPGPADLSENAVHFGAFLDDVLVGVGTIHPQAMPDGYQTSAWRIRGVAVEHGHRGRGVGARIVTRCLERAGSEGGRVVWCLAPDTTTGFFERCGFRSAGPEERDAEDPVLLHIRVGPLKRDWSLPPAEAGGPPPIAAEDA